MRNCYLRCLKQTLAGSVGLAILAGVGTTTAAFAQEAPMASATAADTLVENAPPVGAEVAADPLFQTAYIDIDEMRDEPVPHRYVHGGFEGTDTRFAFYFPSEEQYEGRFFQYLAPQAGNETIGQAGTGPGSTLGFAASSGAYFVESNLGGSQNRDDPTVAGFRASAAAANYSRVIAQRIYGGDRPYGYAYGGSGGAFRTIASVQNTDAWDGVVPYVIGTPMAMPYNFSTRIRAFRILAAKGDQIFDALQPGGSGDPYAGLNDEEAAAYREITRFGFPAEGWGVYRELGGGALAILFPNVVNNNPDYFEAYWTQPGFAGSDPESSQARARVNLETRVVELLTAQDLEALGITTERPSFGSGRGQDNRSDGTSVSAGGGGPFPESGGSVRARINAESTEVSRVDYRESSRAAAAMRGNSQTNEDNGQPEYVAIRVERTPSQDAYLEGAKLVVESGETEGTSIPLGVIRDDIILVREGRLAMMARYFGGGEAAGEVLASLKPGDTVRIDNSDYLAVEDFARHQVPSSDYYTWDQFRSEDGSPLYPQIGDLQGPQSATSGAGTIQNGEFNGKMIVIQTLADTEAYPWGADWYASKVREAKGEDFENEFRLYFIEHGTHGSGFTGALRQSLRDVAAWAEDGVAPPSSTNYEVADGQVLVPETAAERMGIQPVVSLTVGGGDRIDIRVGETVQFDARIVAPPSSGEVVFAEWQLEGPRSAAVEADLVGAPAESVSAQASHTYTEPGTYFPRIVAYAEREGDTDEIVTQVENWDSVRVVVTP